MNKLLQEHVKTLVKRSKSDYFKRLKDSSGDSSLGKKLTNLIQKFVSEVEILANFIESHESDFISIVHKGLNIKQYQEMLDDDEEESYERNILIMAMLLEHDVSMDTSRVYTKIDMIIMLCNSLNKTMEKTGGYLSEKDCGDVSKLKNTHSNSKVTNQITNKAKHGNVTCGTVHSAKGMQWKAVILLRATNELFDEWNEDSDHACINLLYVALSRPMQYLYVTYLEGSNDEPRRDLSSLLKPLLNHRELVISKQYVGAEVTRSFDANLLQPTKIEHSKSKFQSASAILQSNESKAPSKRQNEVVALNALTSVQNKRPNYLNSQQDDYECSNYTLVGAINFVRHKHPNPNP